MSCMRHFRSSQARQSLAPVMAMQNQHCRSIALLPAFSSQASNCNSNKTLDKIYLEGLKFFGRHGVLPEETRDGQHFYVTATLMLDLGSAGKSDDLTQTVNYAEVHSEIQRIVEGPPKQLIESVAEAIAHTILRRHPLVQSTIVRIDKPHAPIDGEFKTVAVEIERRAEM